MTRDEMLFKMYIKDKEETTPEDLKKFYIEDGFDYALFHHKISGKWHLTDDLNKLYIVFEELDDMNTLLLELHDLKDELKNVDFSKYRGHLSYTNCENCIHTFAESRSCQKCNYYEDCMLEAEIDRTIAQGERLAYELWEE